MLALRKNFIFIFLEKLEISHACTTIGRFGSDTSCGGTAKLKL